MGRVQRAPDRGMRAERRPYGLLGNGSDEKLCRPGGDLPPRDRFGDRRINRPSGCDRGLLAPGAQGVRYRPV